MGFITGCPRTFYEKKKDYRTIFRRNIGHFGSIIGHHRLTVCVIGGILWDRK